MNAGKCQIGLAWSGPGLRCVSALCEPRFELYQVVFGSIYVRTLQSCRDRERSCFLQKWTVFQAASQLRVLRLLANSERGLTTVWPPQEEIDKFQQNAVWVSTNEWGRWWKGGRQSSECRGQALHKAIPGTLHLFMLMTRRCITICKVNENQGTNMFTSGFFLTDKSSVV